MTDNLEDLLANVDDLDDFFRESAVEKDNQSESENLEVSVESEEFPETLKEGSGTTVPSGTPESVETASPAEISAKPLEPPENQSAPIPEKKILVPGTKDWNTSS